jgi:hypothetical protein
VTILLVQIPVAVVSSDESRFPDQDSSHILEHLLHYCAKFEPVPVISIVVEAGSAQVTRGHKYLTVARMLGRQTIRALVTSPRSNVDVKNFIARTDVTILDWETIRAREAEERNPKGWHVYFFERALSAAEKTTFDEIVWGLFSDRTIQVHHDDVQAMAEFEAHTPVTDEGWGSRSLAAFSRFDREQVPIASYQGRRFPRY